MRILSVITSHCLALSIGLFFSAIGVDRAEANCGPLSVVERYEIKRNGRTFTLPMFGVVQYEGRTVYTDPDGEMIRKQYYTERKDGWFHPEMGVLVHTDRSFVYIVQYFQNCQGASGAKLLVLNWDGRVMAESWLPANGQFDGFFYLRGALTYWNHSFCTDGRANNEGAYSTIILFDPATGRFSSPAVPYEDYCAPQAMRVVLKKRFLFKQLTPDNPSFM